MNLNTVTRRIPPDMNLNTVTKGTPPDMNLNTVQGIRPVLLANLLVTV